jgi:hypothetical protein
MTRASFHRAGSLRTLWSVGFRVEFHDGQGRSSTNRTVICAEDLILLFILSFKCTHQNEGRGNSLGGEAGTEARNHPRQLAKCSLYIRLGGRQLGEHTQERGQPRHLGPAKLAAIQYFKYEKMVCSSSCRRTPYRGPVEIAHDFTDARASCRFEGVDGGFPIFINKIRHHRQDVLGVGLAPAMRTARRRAAR